MRLTQRELEVKCRYWQKVLRLQDWDIKVRLCRRFEMSKYQAGEADYVVARRTALIRLMDPNDIGPGEWVNYDPELILVHELLHCHFAAFFPLDVDVDEHPRVDMEQAIDSISSGIVTVQRQLDGYKVEERSKRRSDANGTNEEAQES